MTPWEFTACVVGWNRIQSGNRPDAPTEEEYDEAIREYETALKAQQVH